MFESATRHCQFHRQHKTEQNMKMRIEFRCVMEIVRVKIFVLYFYFIFFCLGRKRKEVVKFKQQQSSAVDDWESIWDGIT